MTTTKSTHHDVVVVDGSNIATEGRALPSLAQLNDAVLAFKEEFPDATITVVVDATFGHRIAKAEVRDFDDAVAHNEVVAPPAGAIGRGDAFVLSIANKVGARILSNDSFQEFHGDYEWLFDEGRLIGGKPVPFVGWVFVERLPVKGPTSRKAQRAGRGPREPKPVRRPASKEASQPMPVPSAPPPGARRGGRSGGGGADRTAEVVAETVAAEAVAASSRQTSSPPPSAGAPVNDVLPFLDFVEHHPVGSSVNGVVESYSSHGAYVQIGDLRGYVPLRLMSDPPPRSAREVMRVGDAVTLVVTSFAPSRRSVDLAVPDAVPPGEMQQGTPPEMDALVEAAEALVAAEPTVAKPPSRRRASGRGSAAKQAASELVGADGRSAPAKRAAKKSPAEQSPTEQSPAASSTTRTPAKRSTATKSTASAADASARASKATAKRSAGKSSTAKKATAKKAAAKKATAKKATATSPAATSSPATSSAAKKATAKKSAAKKSAATAKRSTADETTATKTAAKRRAEPVGEAADG